MQVETGTPAACSSSERRQAKGTSRESVRSSSARTSTSSGSAVHAHLAAVEHHHAVGGGRLLHEVGDHHDGHAALVQLAHDAHEPGPSAGVEHSRGLVQDEDGRIHGEHAGNGHALLLAAGKGVGLVRLEALQAHLGERPGHALAQLGVGDAEVLRAEGDVVLDEARHQLVVGVLEDEPRIRADEVGLLGVAGVAAEHVHLALVGQKQRVDVLGQGGLARAVAAEEAQELPLGHGQVQMAEDEGLPIVGEAGIAEIDEDIGAH